MRTPFFPPFECPYCRSKWRTWDGFGRHLARHEDDHRKRQPARPRVQQPSGVPNE
jgi:hypothetical protein